MDIDGQPLERAFAILEEQTGVPIRIGSRALELLPHGAGTEVQATMHDVTLRAGIESLLAPVGMSFAVHNGGIDVVPTEALVRIGRRATWHELETLRDLRAAPWTGQADQCGTLLDQEGDAAHLRGPLILFEDALRRYDGEEQRDNGCS